MQRAGHAGPADHTPTPAEHWPPPVTIRRPQSVRYNPPVPAAHPPPKPCVVCGRPITWRKKWARDWDRVKYCGDGCRRRKDADANGRLEAAILDLLSRRQPSGTICPSEAARRVGGEHWRPLMEPARMAARRLAARGAVEVTQGGRAVDPTAFRGPIRLRLPR